MLRSLRSIARAVALALSVLTALFALAGVWLLTFWNQPLRRRLQHWIFVSWSHAVLSIFNVTVHVVGEPPKGGVLLVTNHLSYTDIPLIAHVLPPRFVAKAEIRSWPIIGWCCRGVETIFVDRSSRRDTLRVGEEIRVGLERGDNVVLFPEGTSGPGHGLMPFKPSLLAPAAASGSPVHYAALRYQTRAPEVPAFLSVSWWGDEPFAPHARRLLQLDGFEATLTFGDQPIQCDDRKELANRLRLAIEAVFEPMVDYEPSSPDNPVPKQPLPSRSSVRAESQERPRQ